MAAFGRSRTRPRGGPLRPFLLLFTISLVILLTRNTDVIRAVSSGATTVLVPVQSLLAGVGSGVDRVVQATLEIERLRTDNARLREENERLTLETVRMREQAIAQQQQAKLDAAARGLPYETVSASVIARDPSGVLRSIVIGGGTGAGIEVGHVVLSEQGLVGRVSEVGPNYAKVVLVTDSSSVVSALVQDSRATGLVRGQFGDTLVMEWILQTEPVKAGDVVVTAGLGIGTDLRSLYPKGLVLGRVVEVAKASDAAYLKAVLLPAVDIRRLERVLVVKG
ncbi:MAG TPA: rod shape-determining protein MreC [Candidatus Limnocylindria bacterium]|nr:rod shape-determining protein MreC [Candidatus Limnocylindria bacterium]